MGIFSQAKSWKFAAVIASYAEKQVEGSEYPWMWEIIATIAEEFNNEVNVFVVAIGLIVLIIVTYAFGKEQSDKHTDFFVEELKRKNEEIERLQEALKSTPSNQEKLLFSTQIEVLSNELIKVKETEKRLKENALEVEVVKVVTEILNEKGIDEALAYLENLDIQKLTEKNREYSKALLTQADLYELRNEHLKANKYYIKSIGFDRNFSNSLIYVDYLAQQNENIKVLKQLQIMELELVFSQDEKIIFLGSIANGYYKQNQFLEAEEAYNEALELYRALAQNN
ncbi:MAG: Unknown protein, partial [uncultured Sulfurovum sp.]